MNYEILSKFGFVKSNQNTLSDFNLQITYSDSLEILERINTFFEKNGIVQSNSIFLFLCKNTILDVLLLIYLIASRKSFLLLNGNENANYQISNNIIAQHFCTVLSCSQLSGKNQLSELHKHIQFSKNENYIKQSVSKNDFSNKIFFKTSGTTGTGKLIFYSLDSIISSAKQGSELLNFNNSNKIIIPTPINHQYGFGAALLPALYSRASVMLINNTSIPLFLEKERNFKPDVTFMTPGLLGMYLKIKRNNYNYKAIVFGGDRINLASAKIISEKFGPLINLYGCTELGIIAKSKSENAECVNKLTAIPNVELKAEKFKGEYYELVCKKELSFEGYLNYESGMIEYRGRDDWYNTHDLVENYNVSQFTLSGRSDFSVNRNGILVSIIEIESIIQENIEEIDSIILTCTEEDEFKGVQIDAFYTSKMNKEIMPDALKSKCSNFLEKRKIPDSFTQLSEIPKLPTGKIDRQAIIKIQEN